MKRETVTSRSGIPTLRVDGVFLHSRYDPLREAYRHVDSLNLTARVPRAVVVIGEGIPYVSQTIIARYPDVAVFAAVLGPISQDHQVAQIDVTSLDPGDLRRWLRRHLSPLDAAALEIVPWEPARRLAPELIAGAERETLEVVRNASTDVATIGSFGRRWLTNSLRSAILVENRSALPHPGTTATLATSGPSLERLVSGGRTAFPGMLTVTSSAWPTLTAFGITPDVVVHTDGGYWASRYLPPRDHRGHRSQPVVAIPAHASVPDTLARSAESYPFSFLSTGWLGEQLHADSEEWRQVPEAPTVTATALHLLHRLSPHGRIYLAGLDLMSRGLLSHARPHPNDRLIAAWAHRLHSEYSIRAERVLGPTVTSERWEDGVIGYRSPALRAFLPEINRILELHRTAGSVVSLMEHNTSLDAGSDPDAGRSEDLQGHRQPAWAPAPTPEAARAPAPAPQSTSCGEQRRPPRAERTAHARGILRTWRDAAVSGRWDENQREILFHLAPVEVLQALRGDLDTETVAASARTTLDALEQVAERISLR